MSSSTTTVIPTPDTAFLDWVNLHDPIFEANAARIGITPGDANGFKVTVENANNAWQAWQEAKVAYKAASQQWRDAKKACRSSGSSIVKDVRTFALRQPDPTEIFKLAAIPAPKQPNFGVPPGTPTEARVELDINTGNLEVRFACDNPAGLSGTVYIVQRRTSTSAAPTTYTAWQQAAVTSVKRFVDTTITSGTASVQYLITAQRGTIQGRPSNPITVQFGRSGTGPGTGVSFTVKQDGAFEPKIAA
jgi:hypothetical protein